MGSLLIFDDDLQTLKFLKTLLEEEFEIYSYPCKNENPIARIQEHRPSLVILDSFDFCKRIKSDSDSKTIPVILISSKNSPSDVKMGLSLGAEDFLTKPFDHHELLLRIKTHLKNVKAVQQIQFIRIGNLEINTVDRSAFYDGKNITLTITEYDILRLLTTRVGSVVSREEIMKVIWKDAATETTDRTIDVHIRSLRKKIPALNAHIKSIYGVGYQYFE